MAVRVRGEQHTTGFQGGVQLQQHARQLLAGYMKQRRVGEHAVEMAIRQIELEEILLPYFGAAVGARHDGQVRGAFQTYRDVTELGERFEVASRPAAEIEDRERRVTLDGSQQRFDVLADVVIARAFPEILRTPVVVFQREVGDFFQVLRSQYDGLFASNYRSAAGATVAGYSGRISKCSCRWALRSAVSASAGLAARAKMNPR
jgi:hypothetical protein